MNSYLTEVQFNDSSGYQTEREREVSLAPGNVDNVHTPGAKKILCQLFSVCP